MLAVPISNRTLFGLETKAERYTLVFWCLFALIINFTGNSLILLATVKYKSIKLDKISVVLIQNIAFSDIMMGICTIHPTMVSLIADRWVYGDFMCYLSHYLKVPIFISAVLLICAMHISKLLNIIQPLQARLRTKREGYRLVIITWFLCFIIPVTQLALDKESVTFDYRLYRCHYVFRGLYWKWLRPILIGTLMVLPNVVVICTTVALLVYVKVTTKQLNYQGILTALYVGLVYILSCAPVSLNQSVITNLYPVMSRDVYWFFFVPYCRYAFFVTFLNSTSNVFVYMVSVLSFRRFVMNKILGNCLRKLSLIHNTSTSRVAIVWSRKATGRKSG